MPNDSRKLSLAPLYVRVSGSKDICFSDRSSCSQMFLKTAALKNYANFTRKHQSWSLILIKLQASRPVTLLKRDSKADVFL